MDFHVFHASHHFGLFFHVFRQFFVLFFVPAEHEKSGISWSNSSDPGQLGDANGRIERPPVVALGRTNSSRVF
jgi:hypothetical protein